MDLLKEAIRLAPDLRVRLVDALLSSLDRPDGAVDREWIAEAEKRIDGYDRGAMGAISLDDVLRKYR